MEQAIDAHVSADSKAAADESNVKPKAKRGRPRKKKNPSGIRPVEFKVVIRAEEVEKVTKGGIIVPISEAEKQQQAATEGTIIAISPLAFGYETWPDQSLIPKIGDRVIFSKYAGMKKKGKDDIEYIIMNDKDIAAVFE